MRALRRWIVGLLAGGLLVGCSRAPEQLPGSGAKECVQVYYEAILQEDWPKAYAALDPQSRGRCSQQQFSQLARNYRASLGFEPEEIHVRACEERGKEATAHVVLTGRTATQDRRYKDSVTLHRGDDAWRVILPPNFGGAKKR